MDNGVTCCWMHFIWGSLWNHNLKWIISIFFVNDLCVFRVYPCGIRVGSVSALGVVGVGWKLLYIQQWMFDIDGTRAGIDARD